MQSAASNRAIRLADRKRPPSRIASPIPALMKIDPQESLDFFRIVTDLCSDGGTLAKLSAMTSIPLSSLGAYKNGTEPTFSVGLCLLRHWEIKTGKTRDQAPMIRRKVITRVRKH